MNKMDLILIISGILLITTTLFIAYEVNAELDFDIDESFEKDVFVIGYGYTCREKYQYASGITTLTLNVSNYNEWSSIVKYYDSDYDLVSESIFSGNKHVVAGVLQYWNDKQLSIDC